MASKFNILQIIPAEGTHVAFTFEDEAEAFQELICWALYEDMEGERFVDGMMHFGKKIRLLCEMDFKKYRFIAHEYVEGLKALQDYLSENDEQ